MADQMPPPPPQDPRPTPPGLAARPAPAGGPIAEVDMTVRNAGLLSVIGGIVVVIGGFMPAVQLTVLGRTANVPGTKLGIGVLFLGGFAVLKGASALRPTGPSQRLSSPLITAALLAALLVWRWSDVHDAIAQITAANPGVTGTMGTGYWLDVAGTVLIAIGGLLLRRANRAR